MERVYLVETEKYPMVDPVTGGHRGPDYYHFEGNDMLNLGRDVGETFITVGKAHVRVKVEGYGEANVPEYVFLDTTESKTITFTATRDRYVLKSVLYDGVDVTAQLVNNSFTITDTEGNHTPLATFEKESKYAITVDADETMVRVDRKPLSGYHYVGEVVEITVTANKGYKIQSVQWNGVEVALTNGAFEITIAAGENKLSVEAVSDGTVIEPNRPQKPAETDKKPTPPTTNPGVNSGCGGVITAMPVGMVALGLGVALILKKKED
jgi:hypothetical protein